MKRLLDFLDRLDVLLQDWAKYAAELPEEDWELQYKALTELDHTRYDLDNMARLVESQVLRRATREIVVEERLRRNFLDSLDLPATQVEEVKNQSREFENGVRDLIYTYLGKE